MKHEILESKKELETQKDRVRKIRNTFNSLTTDVVGYFNKINRILTELEETLNNHPNIEEVYSHHP